MKKIVYRVALVFLVILVFHQALVFLGYTYGVSDYIFSSKVRGIDKSRPVLLADLVDEDWDIACMVLPYESFDSLLGSDERKGFLKRVRGVGNNSFLGGVWRIFFINKDKVFTRAMIGVYTKDSYYSPAGDVGKAFQSAVCASRKDAAFYFDDEFIIFGRVK